MSRRTAVRPIRAGGIRAAGSPGSRNSRASLRRGGGNRPSKTRAGSSRAPQLPLSHRATRAYSRSTNQQLTERHPSGRNSRGVACILGDVTPFKRDPDQVEPTRRQDVGTSMLASYVVKKSFNDNMLWLFHCCLNKNTSENHGCLA